MAQRFGCMSFIVVVFNIIVGFEGFRLFAEVSRTNIISFYILFSKYIDQNSITFVFLISVLWTLGEMSNCWQIPTCGRLFTPFWGFQIKKEFGFRETRKERSILPSTVENSVSRSTFWLAKRHPSNCKTCQNRWHRIQRKFIAQENIPHDTTFNEVDDKVRG